MQSLGQPRHALKENLHPPYPRKTVGFLLVYNLIKIQRTTKVKDNSLLTASDPATTQRQNTNK